MNTRYRYLLYLYGLNLILGLATGCVALVFRLVIAHMDGAWLCFSRLSSPWTFVVSVSFSIGMIFLAYWLVRVHAPCASGSGVQEVEAILAGEYQPKVWSTGLVKFFGGALALGSKLLLGREGPTIHMGSLIGVALAERAKLSHLGRNSLIASGAAAGLAAAFNAPIAGLLFVLEELRSCYRLPISHFCPLALSTIAAVAMLHAFFGDVPMIPVSSSQTPLPDILLPGVLVGLLCGVCAFVFNKQLIALLAVTDRLHLAGRLILIAVVGTLVGGLALYWPDAVGGGEALLPRLAQIKAGFGLLALLFALRYVLSLGSYSIGVPGGIFAPLLALGAVIGCTLHALLGDVFLQGPATLWMLIAMASLFAAVVGAPLTSVLLIVELTGAYRYFFPCMVAVTVSYGLFLLLRQKPLYRLLLKRSRSLNRP